MIASCASITDDIHPSSVCSFIYVDIYTGPRKAQSVKRSPIG